MAEFRIKDNFLVGMLEQARHADFSGMVYGHKVNEETKKTFGYRPYKGGAGPSEEQVRKRNEALLKALQAKGIKASLKMIDIGADEEIQTVEANGRQAGFDRWGYNSDDSDTLDQASFEEALAYLMGKNESKVNEETIDELADLGGIAEALAKENDMSAEKIKEGAQVEFKEHKESIGGDIKIAAKIAIDHMKEDPEYYAKLAKMEAGKNAEGSATPSVVESKAHESIKKISVEEVKKLFKKVDAKYAELLANTCGSKEEIIEKGKSAGLEISESKVNEDRDKEFIAIYQELLAKGLDKNAAFGMAVLRIAKKYNITEFSKDEPKKMTESINEDEYDSTCEDCGTKFNCDTGHLNKNRSIVCPKCGGLAKELTPEEKKELRKPYIESKVNEDENKKFSKGTTQEEISQYLYGLRNVSMNNISSALKELEGKFGLTREEAKEATLYWLEHFKSPGAPNESINEFVRKVGSKWRVVSHKGKNLGEYDTKEEAKKRLGQVEFFKHKNESKVNEASAHIFKIGEKVVMQSGSPISTRFRGIGEVIKVTPLPNVSGGYEIEVKDRNGEIIKTHDNFIKLSSTNEDVAPTGQNPNKYQSIARGIADENEAKKIAMEKKGTVQKDDQDKEGKRFMVVVKESTNEEEKKPVIALFPKAIDFRYIQGKASYKQGTEEYRLLDAMNEALWKKYLNVMAGSGTTVEYDSVKDVFNVTNMTGVGESKINEVSFPIWSILDRNAEHGSEYVNGKDGQLLTFNSKVDARKYIVDVLGPAKGRYEIMPMSDAASQVEARPVGESKVNEEKHEEVKVFELPKCDFCAQDGKDKEAMYDGKTNIGPWANMCKEHFSIHGTGLGLGKGQKLVKADAPKKMKISFEDWMKEVNKEVESAVGMSANDLPDYCYRDAYDDGKSPKSVAKAAIRSSNESTLDNHYGSRDEKDLALAMERLEKMTGHTLAPEREKLRKEITELRARVGKNETLIEKKFLVESLMKKLEVEGINEQEEKFLKEFEAEFSHLSEDAKKAIALSVTKLKEEAAKMLTAPYAVGNVKKGDSIKIANMDSQSGHLSFDVVESATGKVAGRLSFDSSAEAKEAGWQV